MANLSILIVDNTASFRTFLKLILETLTASCQVVVAPDWRNALVQLEQETFHLILADEEAHGDIDPCAAIKSVRQMSPETRVVLMTSADFYESGAVEQWEFDHCIQKRFVTTQLLKIVDGSKWPLQNGTGNKSTVH